MATDDNHLEAEEAETVIVEDRNDSSSDAESGRASGELIPYKDNLPGILHLLPLANRPLFPGQIVPLIVDLALWHETLKAITETPQKVMGLVAIRTDEAAAAEPQDFYEMGTVCRIHSIAQSEEKMQVMVEGLQRFRIEHWVTSQKPFVTRVRYYPENRQHSSKHQADLKPYVLAVINTIKELLPLNPLYGEELRLFLDRFGPDDPPHLADFAASMTTSSKAELQDILQTVPLPNRLEKVLILLNKELETAGAQMQIRKQVEEKMHKQQREFFLREQLKVIQKELGIEKDDRTAELDMLQKRLESLVLTDEAEKRIQEEMGKFSILETGSPEYTVVRNYLDWLTLLPWGHLSKDKLNIRQARRILDRDHEGLEDVKDRIIEFISVGRMKGSISGTILLLVGPPGVGKTSIGRSIANTLGRKFYRFSLGGMQDVSEIKGHRRTYIGAMPGKFLQAIKETGYANPVIMLDEIDKIGASYRGDPASALLEVLDPEQNTDFLDHYLDVRFDLSKVLFICTANQLDTIPGPLLDRMEVIRLSGYLGSEKLQIARKHLLKKQLERAGLKSKQLTLTDSTLTHIIEGYAREAGVRNLEKHLGSITRKAAVKILEGEKTPIKVTARNLSGYLGKPLFENEEQMQGIGIITGLAWTSMGGATLSIEATRVHNKSRGFKLTGQLGDVMRESAEIAYSHLISQSDIFGVSADFFDNAFIHLHVPAGATPKDGPSAGITIASALLSLALNKPCPTGIAMTGELTLTGQVLAIGGVREKIIAARRIKIFEVILPAANQRDFEELPVYIRSDMTAFFVKNFAEVARILKLP